MKANTAVDERFDLTQLPTHNHVNGFSVLEREQLREPHKDRNAGIRLSECVWQFGQQTCQSLAGLIDVGEHLQAEEEGSERDESRHAATHERDQDIQESIENLGRQHIRDVMVETNLFGFATDCSLDLSSSQ